MRLDIESQRPHSPDPHQSSGAPGNDSPASDLENDTRWVKRGTGIFSVNTIHVFFLKDQSYNYQTEKIYIFIEF